MIDKLKYNTIKSEVSEAISTSLDQIRDNDEMGYILLLANGEYDEVTAIYDEKHISPFLIENHIDRYFDGARDEFLTDLLNNFYLLDSDMSYYDDKQIVHLEMMTYTHIWESILMLKKLSRIAYLLKGDGYKWSIKFNKRGKYKFIRSEIKSVLDKDCALYHVIDKAYRSTLRNSFAHSLYYFSSNDTISFNHINANSYDLKNISIAKWREHFLYSALLSKLLISILDERKLNITNELGKHVFPIIHPSRNNKSIIERQIVYRDDIMEFDFMPGFHPQIDI